jgi:myo-inositol catabolism protein IolS
MKIIELGNLKGVSNIGFGGGAISGEGKGYGFGKISFDESVRLLQEAYETGINLFDTAPIYGFHESEKRMGAAFKKIREKVYIVSKSGVTWHDSKRVNMTNDPKTTEKMIHDSLKALDTEYIDLYMIHWPDQNVDIRKPLEVIKKAQDQGKIKSIGLCNTNLEDLEKSVEVCEVKTIQVQFNYFEQKNLDLIKWANNNKISVMSWGTFDQGILSGRVTIDRKFDPEDCRSWAPWWDKELVKTKVTKLAKIIPVLDSQNISLQSFALSFNYHHGVDLCLVGSRNSEQLKSLKLASENLIGQTLFEEILANIKN